MKKRSNIVKKSAIKPYTCKIIAISDSSGELLRASVHPEAHYNYDAQKKNLRGKRAPPAIIHVVYIKEAAKSRLESASCTINLAALSRGEPRRCQWVGRYEEVYTRLHAPNYNRAARSTIRAPLESQPSRLCVKLLSKCVYVCENSLFFCFLEEILPHCDL